MCLLRGNVHGGVYAAPEPTGILRNPTYTLRQNLWDDVEPNLDASLELSETRLHAAKRLHRKIQHDASNEGQNAVYEEEGMKATIIQGKSQEAAALQGSDVRPGVPWSPPLCRWLLRGRVGGFCVAAAALGAMPRGRMYAVASLGLRRSAGGFCVAGPALGALPPGVGCTPWRPLVSAAVAFGWQAWNLVPRGRMYPIPSLGLRRSAGGVCVAGVGLGALPRGRMYAVPSLGLRRSAGCFCVAGVWNLVHCQGVGCTPWLCRWRLRGRCGLVLCKGSDVRPGVPWSLGGSGAPGADQLIGVRRFPIGLLE